MKILILGNSNIFKKKIYPALRCFKKLFIEMASRSEIEKKYKIDKSYLSYDEALKKTDAKIVYISLINSEHYKWAIKAMNLNKHVIIDKPITLSLANTKKLIKLANKKKVLLSESIVFQNDLRFKKMITKLDLNKTTQIYCKFHIPKLENDNFRNFKKYGGGCFEDMSPYAAYLIYFFFKNKNYSIKSNKKTLKGFKLQLQSKNIFFDASFSFNDEYKNEIYIHNKAKTYFINYFLSPPIDKKLSLKIFDNVKLKKHTINFPKQNVFYPYFCEFFKVLIKRKYNFSYDQINKTSKIKKKFPKIFVWSYLEDYKKNKEKILKISDRVFGSGNLILSKEVMNFENNFAKFTNSNYGIGVNSGTDALQIALMSIGIKRDDEVLTVSNTAVPTVSAIISCNAKPVFVDVNEEDFLINTKLIEKKITKKTKAIIPVNLYGQSANYESIKKISKKYNLKIIEDCAQSTGAFYKNKPTGSLGDLGAFSFYPTKNLGGYGDGGMIVTKNNKLYLNCKKLRKYGMTKNYYAEIHGINSRLDEIQAAILNFQLTKLKSNIIKRRKIAKIYNENIKTPYLQLPIENKDNYHSYYVYVVKHPQRKKIMHFLKDNDIFCNISYPYPIHSMKAYKYLNKKNDNLKITNKLSKQIFSLPMYPELSNLKLEKIINIINKF